MTDQLRERDFCIRQIEEDELEEMTKVWSLSGLPYRPKGRDSMENLKYQRSRDPDLFLAAFSGDRMVGVVVASDDGRKGWVNRLAVLEEFRRYGIGTALVEASEKALRDRGRGVFSILIEGENEPSEDLFLKCGYKAEHDIRYYAKRDSDDV